MQSGALVAHLVFSSRSDRAVFSFAPLSFGRFVDFDVTHARKTFRIIASQKFNQTFAHFAAEIERPARIGAADKRAHFDRALRGVGDL